jgi:hypothetical protein
LRSGRVPPTTPPPASARAKLVLAPPRTAPPPADPSGSLQRTYVGLGALEVDADGKVVPVSRREASSLRYVVSAGERPGELTLRALEPGEPPPFGAPIARIAPSCAVDARIIDAMLERR